MMFRSIGPTFCAAMWTSATRHLVDAWGSEEAGGWAQAQLGTQKFWYYLLFAFIAYGMLLLLIKRYGRSHHLHVAIEIIGDISGFFCLYSCNTGVIIILDFVGKSFDLCPTSVLLLPSNPNLSPIYAQWGGLSSSIASCSYVLRCVVSYACGL